MDFQKIRNIIRETRKISLPQFGNPDKSHNKDENHWNVVTNIDQEVEEYLKTNFANVDPGVSFVGEESGGKRDHERFWLADPIDCTANYVRGLPFCNTMVALIEQGRVTFSAIYHFLTDELYWAELGEGSYKDNLPIHVSSRNLKNGFIVTETHVAKPKNLSIFAKLAERTLQLEYANCGWDFSMVACGKLDARISFDPYGCDWDFAPGAFLVAEAGGVSANIGSHKYDYRNLNIISANPIIYSELTTGPDAIFPIK